MVMMPIVVFTFYTAVFLITVFSTGFQFQRGMNDTVFP